MVKFATLASLTGTILSARAAATSAFDGLTNTQINNVRARLLDSAHARHANPSSLVSLLTLTPPSRSWEIGTAVQALLEIDTPGLSVFGKTTIPPPSKLNHTSDILRYAGRWVAYFIGLALY